MATAALLSMMHPAAEKTAAPLATTGTKSSSSSSDSSTITANDFLTLLVTEMKNQDPTANTDPNQYINQLVQVNSLQQLIGIKEVLTDSLGGSSGTSTAGNGTTTYATQVPTSQAEAIARTLSPAGNAVSGAAQTAGNLGIPQASASSIGIAHALDGSHRTAPAQITALSR